MVARSARVKVVTVLAALLAGSAVAARDTFDAATADAIKTVVSRQLDAFARGDAAGAEAFAAPGIRDRFPDPAQFYAMVKTHYGALIRPKSTTFAGVESTSQGPVQKVIVVAADGSVWLAVYALEKVEGQWRITGCGLEEDKNQQAI